MRFVLAFLILTAPMFGWHQVGHKVIAAICYDELTPKARAKVDALLKQHPDYVALVDGDKSNPARRAFINAAGWPDAIKGDARFYDDTRRDAKPTPALAGFPDMKRHTDWHYININFSPDGTPFPPPPEPNVLTQLKMIFAEIAGPKGTYLLPWLEHLVGDVHQPLHNSARWTAEQRDRNGKPQSDRGGNGVNVDGYTNLHAVWDDALGTTEDTAYIDWMATRLRRENAAEKQPNLDLNAWVAAGSELAQTAVYTFGPELGTSEKPFRRTAEYTRRYLTISRKQGALAGHRMAAFLNQQFR